MIRGIGLSHSKVERERKKKKKDPREEEKKRGPKTQERRGGTVDKRDNANDGNEEVLSNFLKDQSQLGLKERG